MKRQTIQLVDYESIESRMLTFAEDTVSELYQFGQLMVSETQQRAAHLDSKLTSIMGWSTAALAFLLIDDTLRVHKNWLQVLAIVTTLFVLAAVTVSGIGLKTTLWAAPSEQDWFQEELLANADKLRRYHVMSMLFSHQHQHQQNALKAKRLRCAEGCLFGGAVGVAVILVWKVVAVAGRS